VMSLNRWNKQKIYSEILMVEVHVTCQNYRLFLGTNENFGTILVQV
jgi:hypothetical protein